MSSLISQISLVFSLSLVLIFSCVARASSVAQVNGKQVEIQLSANKEMVEGSLYYLVSPEGIKLGIIRIDSVAMDKGFGTLLKGKAESGWTLVQRDARSTAGKKTGSRNRRPASIESEAKVSVNTTTIRDGFFGEPYVGFGNYIFTVSFLGQSVSSSGSGYAFGGRLGYVFDGLFTALNVGMAMASNSLSSSSSSSAAVRDVSLEIGGSFEHYRIFAGILSETIASSSTSITGTGFKLGASYTGFPLVATNLEYSSVSYSQIAATVSSVVLTASFPIGF